MVRINRAIDRGIDLLDIELPSEKAAICGADVLRPVITDTFYNVMRRSEHEYNTTAEFLTKVQCKPITKQLSNLAPVSIRLISGSALEPLWDQLVRCYHYLGYQRLIGHRLKYIAFVEDQPVAALSWSAPALKLAARDRFIGWSDAQRKRHLNQLAGNSRFVILPWVKIPNLASHVLSLNIAQLSLFHRPPPTKIKVEELVMLLEHCQWHPQLVADLCLDESDVEAMAKELVEFHQEFHNHYGRIEHQRLGLAYISGLMSNAQAKSVEPIALELLNKASVRCLQMFMRKGPKPIVAKVARIQVYLSRDGLPVGDRQWLFLRKNPEGKIKYAISNAPEQTCLADLIKASIMRWPIEQCFQEGKGQLGMDKYEHRSWPAWHRHMIYVFLALHFLLRLRIKFKKTPLLTLPQARRQLAAVIPLRSLSLKGTMEIIEYHMQRNLIAYESHRKKNEEVAQKLNAKVSL